MYNKKDGSILFVVIGYVDPPGCQLTSSLAFLLGIFSIMKHTM